MPTTTQAPSHAIAAGGLPWLAAVLLACCGSAAAQTIDPGFTPGFDDTVRAIAVEADGRILVGGQFNSAAGQVRPMLARLTTSGVLDASQPAMPNDRVRAIVVQADGRIVIGGEFDEVGGSAQPFVARLLANGAPDPAFQSQVGNSALGVTDLAVQADGRIVVIGGFSTVSGQPRDRIARLGVNGAVDPGFVPPPLGSPIDALMLQPDGRVVIAGHFSDASADCESYCVLRLASNGTVDGSFAVTRVVGAVNHLVRQTDGRILVAGNFGGLDDHDSFFIGRLNANGGADTGFSNTALRFSNISRVVALPDQRIIIGGEMRWGTGGASEDRLARLTSGGARDTTFNEPVLNSMIVATALQADNRLLVGGMFTQFGGLPRARLARILVADLPDTVFTHGFE